MSVWVLVWVVGAWFAGFGTALLLRALDHFRDREERVSEQLRRRRP